MKKKPELLAPAGDMEKLKMAVLYGADAVYLAGTSFGMRSFAGNFTAEELPQAVRFAHDRGVRVRVHNRMQHDEGAHPEHSYPHISHRTGDRYRNVRRHLCHIAEEVREHRPLNGGKGKISGP